MSHTLITVLCEGCASCVPICPKECISQNVSLEGASFFSIDEARCTDCGACTSVCPIEGALVTFAEPARSNSPSVGEALQSLISQAKLRARFDDRMAARLALWSTDCAARVVCLYEAEAPTDRTVRNAVLAARERAHALFQFGCETHEWVVKGHRVESDVKSRLEATRVDCARWEERVVVAAEKAQSPAAKIAADAAGAACRGVSAADRAARALGASQPYWGKDHVRNAKEAEELWQLKRLRERISSGEIEDWHDRGWTGAADCFHRFRNARRAAVTSCHRNRHQAAGLW